jgi:hypothetical protein
MLDVHPPHETIHGFRDFLIHLLTITAGLLIALGLEASVEAMHHRHQRKEADAMIRQEIEDNRKDLMDSSQGLKAEIASMTKVLTALEEIAAGQRPVEDGLQEDDLQFREGPMQDSAWRTANSTGALSYMEYAEVKKFSEAYKEQDQLEAMEVQALNDYLQLVPILSHHGKEVTPQRAKDALPFARSAMGHLSGLYFIGVGTVTAYDAALK